MLLMAPGRFHSIFGRWPATWSELREVGLVQAPLYDPTGKVVDPDATVGNQLRYITAAANERPTILSQCVDEAGVLRYNKPSSVAAPPRTWREYFASLDPRGQEVIEPVLNNQAALVMLELVPLLHDSIGMYMRVHGTIPATFEDLLDSRMAPIDRNSINPITKEPFYGDGRPNDFLYRPSSTKENAFMLTLVAPDGSTPWYGVLL